MNVEKLKIFVSAYACEPNLGSEIGVGWHWVSEMSKKFSLWVLTRESNKHNIESWLNRNRLPGEVNFIYYDLPKWARFWKKGLRGVRLYYVLWQRFSNSIVKKTIIENQIDIFHLLTYGNAFWPVSHYGQKKFFIWGPTGIGDYIPYEFSKHYGLKWQTIECVRRFIMKTLPVNIGFTKRCKNAQLIFCKTEATKRSIPLKYKYKAKLFTDVAIEQKDISQYICVSNGSSESVQYIAVGRLDAWRGFDLLIEAFSKAVQEVNDINLEIVGYGSDKSRLQALIKKNQMEDHIVLTGQITHEEYYFKLAKSDVVVNPGLKEGSVTVAFDSMLFGKPLICVDTGGYTNSFNKDFTEIIARTNRSEVIDNLKNAILKLKDSNIRKLGSKKIIEASHLLLWEFKGEQISNIIYNCYTQLSK